MPLPRSAGVGKGWPIASTLNTSVAPVLGTITVSPATGTFGVAYNGTASGKTAGSQLSLTGAGAPGLAVTGTTISGTPTASGAFSVVETLAGATGNPKTSPGGTIAAVAPAAPTLSVASGNAQNVLTFADGSNGGSAITGHNLYRGTTSGGETMVGTITTGSPYTDTGLTNGTTYYYKFSAVNAVGEGPQSAEASATPAGGAYSFTNPEAKAYVTRTNPSMSDTYKAAYDKFWSRLKVGAVNGTNLATGAFDILYIRAAPDQTTALANLMSTSFTSTLSATPPVFTPGYGFTTNGVGGYVDWGGWTPAMGVNFTQNSASFGAWMRKPEVQPVSGNSLIPSIGGSTSAGNNTYLIPNRTGYGEVYKINASATMSGGSNTSVTDASGLSVAVRYSSTQSQYWKGKTDFSGIAQSGSDSTVASVALGTVPIREGNSNGTFTENQIAFSFAGRALTALEMADLYAAMTEFLTAISWTPLVMYTTTFANIPTYTAGAAIDSVTTPDNANSVAGKGFTCVGIAPDPDGTWWVGDYGRETQQGTTTTGARLVHITADRTTLISDWDLTSLLNSGAGLSVSPLTMQGVAYGKSPDGTQDCIWVNLLSYVMAVSKTGTYLGSFAVTGSNGLSYDSKRDLLVLNGPGNAAALLWYTRAGVLASAAVSPSVSVPAFGADQSFYAADLDAVMVTTGANGSAAQVLRVDMTPPTYGVPRISRVDLFPAAANVEGVVRKNGLIYIADDGFYHGAGQRGVNSIFSFTAPY